MTEPVRLSKRVVELMGCSRSEADQYIEDGWVSVDGRVVEEPQHKVTDEAIAVEPLARLTPTEPATILLHKPAGLAWGDEALALVERATRWADDSPEVRTLERHRARLAPILPLEPLASGLAIFTQDRRVSQRMDEEGARIEQEIIAEVSGEIAKGGLERLAQPLVFERRHLPGSKVSWQNEHRLRFAIKGPRPGQIEHMCSGVGLTVVGLKRIRLGRIPLAKMPPGAWRYLPVRERF